ncbi:MAG: hypothetical protein GYA24_10195 [Candidatus Lokiarchaeota archaeon]|nr:hypothetical protein [Candidatus Lokiarchaeota archaeon]
MVSNTTIPAGASGRFIVALEPAVVDLIDKLGLDEDAAAELVGLTAEVPPEARIAFVLGVYDELAMPDAEPNEQDF